MKTINNVKQASLKSTQNSTPLHIEVPYARFGLFLHSIIVSVDSQIVQSRIMKEHGTTNMKLSFLDLIQRLLKLVLNLRDFTGSPRIDVYMSSSHPAKEQSRLLQIAKGVIN